jgi:hypothetical protein
MRTRMLIAVALGTLWLASLARADGDSEAARVAAETGVPKAWITLASAVQRVALSCNSATVVEASLGMEGGQLRYLIRTVSNAGFSTVKIDAQNGAFSVLNGDVGVSIGDPEDDDKILGELRIRAAATSAFELCDAVEAASLLSQGAIPCAAYFNLQQSELVVSVEVLHGAFIERLDFNATNGAVIVVNEGAEDQEENWARVGD